MNNVYGIVIDGTHKDVSLTERGAKNYATRNGYGIISVRYSGGYNAVVVSEKKGNKWAKVAKVD